MSMLTGKGTYIWQVRKCDGGETGRIVNHAQQAGLTHVLIKTAVGAAYFAHDAAGNRTMMEDGSGATYWTYDAVNRITNEEGNQ